MRRRHRTLLWLAGICAALAIAVYFQIRRENVVDRLSAIDPAQVRSLRVECRGCTTRRFERVDGHWQMREPSPVRADDAAVERLLAIAGAPVRFRHPRGALDAGKIGLDPPQAVLTLDATVLRFGATDAINGDRYVDAGATIALVPDRFSALLFEPAEREMAVPPAAAQ
ncbi:hypothetical protein [Dokdonella sp.]|uniref:hypothetical protein n=1 Tax=Dokdonella sp. TaxID=2291710 RepID=UPI0025BEAF6A|nr:hypothetical protein [Dokdonella sp.]MBX3688708.1 hypothetical protein [Dokdonella sp.]